MKYKWQNHRIGRIFNGMKRRCYNSTDKNYRWYGAKGVTICNEWLEYPPAFELWALANGYTDELTIDRIHADDGYCPSNCRWIAHSENARIAGKVNWIECDGCVLTGKQWAEKLGIGPNTINSNIRRCGVEKTKKLIEAMLIDPPQNHTLARHLHETWMDVYGIQ